MSEEHTKGPWFVNDAAASKDTARVTCQDGTVAECSAKGSARPRHFANARLIAAAPDLFAVLKQIHEDYKKFAETGDGDLFDERLGANMEDAGRALAKAEPKTGQ